MSSNIEFVNTELNGGFLSGFVESSVEKPADGRNGECIHYNCKSFSVAIICCAKILKFWRLIFMSTGNTSIH